MIETSDDCDTLGSLPVINPKLKKHPALKRGDMEYGKVQNMKRIEGKTRKRKRDPETWKCNKRKKTRCLGLEYETAQGKTMSRKQFKMETCSCHLNCHEQFTKEELNDNFIYFWPQDNRTCKWEEIPTRQS